MKALAACFDPISLDELNARAALLSRVDNKYFVDFDTVEDLVDALRKHFVVLEIEDRRVFSYERSTSTAPSCRRTTPTCRAVAGASRLRSRRYVESDLNVFEVKLKGLRGNTDKRQLRIDADAHGTITEDAAALRRRHPARRLRPRAAGRHGACARA